MFNSAQLGSAYLWKRCILWSWSGGGVAHSAICSINIKHWIRLTITSTVYRYHHHVIPLVGKEATATDGDTVAVPAVTAIVPVMAELVIGCCRRYRSKNDVSDSLVGVL